MTNKHWRKKFQISWQLFQYSSLVIITFLFWYGIYCWLKDGAWENGEFPTHGMQHMAAGFLVCWASYLYLLWTDFQNLKKPKKKTDPV